METTMLKINHDFFDKSSYKHDIEKEKEDDSYGLIYDEIFHDLGLRLGVDIIWNSLNANKDKWLITNDEHMQILLHDKGHEYEKKLEIVPKTKEGTQRIEQLKKDYQEEFGQLMTFL